MEGRIEVDKSVLFCFMDISSNIVKAVLVDHGYFLRSSFRIYFDIYSCCAFQRCSSLELFQE